MPKNLWIEKQIQKQSLVQKQLLHGKYDQRTAQTQALKSEILFPKVLLKMTFFA